MRDVLSNIVVVVAIATLISNVAANSSGTGSCLAGIAAIEAIGSPHIITATKPGMKTSLVDAGVTFSINGNPLTADISTSFPVGTALSWSVDASATPYKGIFVRVEKASDDFTHVGDAALVKDTALCSSSTGVVGVDHINSATKTQVTGTTNFATSGSAVVDITVVFDNIASSTYAFSSFQLNLEDGAAPVPVSVTVPTPVVAPVPGAVPTTDPPVAVPTPVEAPVEVVPTPVVETPTVDPPTDGECPESGKGKGKGGKGDDTDESGKGKGMSGMMMGGMKCKKGKESKEPKEPKTPKAGKDKKDSEKGTTRRRLM
jgi:hypothetical protein